MTHAPRHARRRARTGTALAATLGVVAAVSFVGVVNAAGRAAELVHDDVGGYRPSRAEPAVAWGDVPAVASRGTHRPPVGVEDAAGGGAVALAAAVPAAPAPAAAEPPALLGSDAESDLVEPEVAGGSEGLVADALPAGAAGYGLLDAVPGLGGLGGLGLLPPSELTLSDLLRPNESAPPEPGVPELLPEPASPTPEVRLPMEESFVLTAGFGRAGRLWRHLHTGLDFAAPAGTPVRAVEDGVVVSAGWAGAYGNRIILAHPDGTRTWYCHLARIFPGRVPGAHFDAGDGLGREGASGNATGPHLHLEVRVAGQPVDPLHWLRAAGAPI